MINKKISDTIANINFPLMVGVVMSHCMIQDSGNEVMDGVSRLFSSVLPISCVPLFFLMSGFLLFINIKKFTYGIYIEKIKSRIRTLLIPYILANTFMLLCYGIMHKFTPTLINPDNFNVLKYSLCDLLKAFWSINGEPICYPLWYVRNLFIMVLCLPLFYLLVRQNNVKQLLSLCIVAYASHIFGVGLFYFYIGVFLAQKKINVYLVKLLNKKVFISVTIVALVAIYYNYQGGNVGWRYLQQFSVAVLLVVLFYMISSRYGRAKNIVFEASFFIYLFHAFPVLVIRKLLIKVISPSESIVWVITYFLLIFCVILLCVLTYCILKKYTPSFLNLLMGGRVNRK